MRSRLLLVAALVGVPLVLYPLVTVAGGSPRFPTRAECARPAVEGQPVQVVWGRFEDPGEARELRDSVVAVGFIGTEVVPDGCGLLKVSLDGVPSLEVAREIVAEAETVDLYPTLELDPDG
jgi:hypothetical protein